MKWLKNGAMPKVDNKNKKDQSLHGLKEKRKNHRYVGILRKAFVLKMT